MAETSKPANKQVFDIAKPGKTAASATSRPVIVNHGPIMKDPMVSEDASNKASEPIKGLTHKVIVPPSEAKAAEDESASATVEPESDAAPAVDEQTASAVTEESKPDKPAEPESTELKKNSDQAAVDAFAEQAIKKKQAPSEEDIAKANEVEKLIESKKYALPIDEVRHRRNTRMLNMLLVSFVVIVVGGYLAIDAGLLNTSFQLPFEIIKD